TKVGTLNARSERLRFEQCVLNACLLRLCFFRIKWGCLALAAFFLTAARLSLIDPVVDRFANVLAQVFNIASRFVPELFERFLVDPRAVPWITPDTAPAARAADLILVISRELPA